MVNTTLRILVILDPSLLHYSWIYTVNTGKPSSQAIFVYCIFWIWTLFIYSTPFYWHIAASRNATIHVRTLRIAVPSQTYRVLCFVYWEYQLALSVNATPVHYIHYTTHSVHKTQEKMCCFFVWYMKLFKFFILFVLCTRPHQCLVIYIFVHCVLQQHS